jgi:hypothetical protein
MLRRCPVENVAGSDAKRNSVTKSLYCCGVPSKLLIPDADLTRVQAVLLFVVL